MRNAVYIALPLWQYRSELPSEVRWTLCPTFAALALGLSALALGLALPLYYYSEARASGLTKHELVKVVQETQKRSR